MLGFLVLSQATAMNSSSQLRSQARSQIPFIFFWQLIEHTLTRIRGKVMKTLPKRTAQLEDYSRPWAIIRLLPDARLYTVARFANCQEAEDHRRFLSRFIPAAEFEVLKVLQSLCIKSYFTTIKKLPKLRKVLYRC